MMAQQTEQPERLLLVTAAIAAILVVAVPAWAQSSEPASASVEESIPDTAPDEGNSQSVAAPAGTPALDQISARPRLAARRAHIDELQERLNTASGRAAADRASLELRTAINQLEDPTESALRLKRLAAAELEKGRPESAEATLKAAWRRAEAVPDSAVRDLALRQLASLATRFDRSPEILADARTRVLAIRDPDVRVGALRELGRAAILAGEAGQQVRDLFVSDQPVVQKDRRLLEMARFQLFAGLSKAASLTALAVERDAGGRDKLLAEIVDREILWERDYVGIEAYKAILDHDLAANAARGLVAYELGRGQVSAARETALGIDLRRPRLLALLDISQFLLDERYLAQADRLLREVALHLSPGSDSDVGQTLEAQRFALLLGREDADAALGLWALEGSTNPAIQARLPALAEVLVRSDRTEDLIRLRQSLPDSADRLPVDEQTAKSIMRSRGLKAVADFAEKLPDSSKVAVMLYLVANDDLWDGSELAVEFRSRFLAEAEPLVPKGPSSAPKDQETQVKLVGALLAMDMQQQAREVANRLPLGRRGQPDVQRLLAIADAMGGAADEGLERAGRMRSNATRIETIRNVAEVMMRQREFRNATTLARAIPDWPERVKAFGRLAREQARMTGIIQTVEAAEDLSQAAVPLQIASEPTAIPESGEAPAAQAVPPLDVSPLFNRANLRFAAIPQRGSHLPELPDLKGVDPRTIRGRVPAIRPGRMHVTFLHYSKYNEKFMEEVGKLDLVRQAQRGRYPRYIFLESGVFDLPTIASELRERGEEGLLVQSGRTYLLKMPLLIGPDATLVVSGTDVDALHMSRQAVSYLVNAGHLFVIDTELTSWDESTGDIAMLDYKSRRDFRPFFLGWSGSETWVAQSRIAGLGYQSGKAYGMSFSAGPTNLLRSFGSVLARPTGAIVDSVFDHMLYGYYSYEADGMKVVGNTYENNVVYGVDPHDRSHNLTFAYNTAYGTQVKHGLISSREVDNTWWFGNVSFDNAGSGLMLDRDSEGSFIFANLLFGNRQDGLTFFESSCSLAMGNQVFGNDRNGILLRNSWFVSLLENQVTSNHRNAVIAYTSVLDEPTRDLQLDPYYPVTSVTLRDNLLSGQRDLVNLKSVSSVVLGKNQMIGKRLIGGLPDRADRDLVGWAGQGVAMINQCGMAPPKPSCPLVEQGFIVPEPMPEPSSAKAPSCQSDVAEGPTEDGRDVATLQDLAR